eukprot:3928947-Prymnesium_polylepis.3
MLSQWVPLPLYPAGQVHVKDPAVSALVDLNARASCLLVSASAAADTAFEMWRVAGAGGAVCGVRAIACQALAAAEVARGAQYVHRGGARGETLSLEEDRRIRWAAGAIARSWPFATQASRVTQ